MQNNFFTSLMGNFRLIALCEGISFIVLLFIAMPLKYFWDKPAAVKYVGWMHGILFVLFLYFLLRVWLKYGWPFRKVAGAFIASLLPFGTFILVKRLQKEYPL